MSAGDIFKPITTGHFFVSQAELRIEYPFFYPQQAAYTQLSWRRQMSNYLASISLASSWKRSPLLNNCYYTYKTINLTVSDICKHQLNQLHV